jgi:hypothetical protein
LHTSHDMPVNMVNEYVVTIRPEKRVGREENRLRSWLKLGLRTFGLRCIRITAANGHDGSFGDDAVSVHEKEPDMKFTQLFPTRYLKAADFDGGPEVMEIAGVGQDTMSDGEVKPILKFTNSKSMVLNITNGRMLASLYGHDCDKWAGKWVQLVSTYTDFGGKQTPCIRLRPPPAKPSAGKGTPAKATDEADEDVPF